MCQDDLAGAAGRVRKEELEVLGKAWTPSERECAKRIWETAASGRWGLFLPTPPGILPEWRGTAAALLRSGGRSAARSEPRFLYRVLQEFLAARHLQRSVSVLPR